MTESICTLFDLWILFMKEGVDDVLLERPIIYEMKQLYKSMRKRGWVDNNDILTFPDPSSFHKRS